VTGRGPAPAGSGARPGAWTAGLALLAAATIAGAATRIATTASARDFLSGDATGTAVTADGRLTLGVPLGPKEWPDDAADAVVFGAASDAEGRIYVATGGGLGRLFVSEPSGKIRLLFTAPEPNVTAVTVGPDGTVVCASSPDGRLYRVDPSAKSPAAAGADWGSPKEAAIWALAFGRDGTLYVGTGSKGRIWRRNPSGKVDLFQETDDVHVRSLAVGPDGTLFAGTSDRGVVLAISPDGRKRTLYDSSRPEVSGLVAEPDGTVYAAASTAESAPPRAAPGEAHAGRPGPTPTPTPTPPPSAEEEAPRGAVSISTRTSRVTPPPARGAGGSGDVVAIHPDGFAEPVWSFPDEAIFSLRAAGDGGLVVTTGPRGRVYVLKDRRLRLVAQTGEHLAVAAPRVGQSLGVVTMGAPGVFRPATTASAGTFTSAVRDAARLSRFGRLRFEGTEPDGSAVSFEVRAGNSGKPDATWTSWVPVAADGSAKLPAARFFQWKATLSPGRSGAAPVVEQVEFSYAERNARPVLESLTVLEPGAVLARGASSGSNVLTVTNPDENGIYAGLEPPREPSVAEPGGRHLFRKGFRTVVWRGIDPNGDSLRYEVDALRDGTGVWFPIRKDLDEPWCSFDSIALPDGRYRFRVTASDRPGNPEGEALTATEETGLVLIDNTPPVLKVESARTVGAEIEVRVLATDALSPVTKAEAAVNADRWRPLAAEDGVGDSPTERYVLRVAKPDKGALLSVRVLDASGNWAAMAVEYPKDFR
jgi:outer membrane protein assembly factor BamB